jgi:hypothetical protein
VHRKTNYRWKQAVVLSWYKRRDAGIFFGCVPNWYKAINVVMLVVRGFHISLK